MSVSPLHVSAEARRLRGLALEKAPGEEPLIVKTGVYADIARTLEKNIAIVRAPFGSGKTTGIAMKLYHDGRLQKPPAGLAHVVVVRVRGALNESEWFNQYVRSNINRVMCGGLYLTMFQLVARDDNCYKPNSYYCYSTLTKRERSRLLEAMDRNSAILRALKCPSPDAVTEALRVVLNTLEREHVYLVVDEVEGFEERLGSLVNLSLAEAIKSYLAAARLLYDNNIRGVKLVLLIQSKVIEDKWEDVRKYIEDWRPGMDVECSCSGRRIVYSPGSAVEGVAQPIALAYYNSYVYVEYLRELFTRLTFKYPSSELSRRLGKLADEIVESSTYVERKLAFLEQMAPRIAFDYVDDIASYIVLHYSQGKSLEEALNSALNLVASEWRTHSGLKRYYAYLVKTNVDLFEGRGAVLSRSDVEDMIKTLLNKLGDAKDCIVDATRYYSIYAGLLICPGAPTRPIQVSLFLFRPSKYQASLNAARYLSQRVSRQAEGLVKMMLESLKSKGRRINLFNTGFELTGLALLREGSRPEATRVLQQIASSTLSEVGKTLQRIAFNDSSKARGGPERIPVRLPLHVPVVKLSDEEFIILYLATINRSLEGDEGRFVHERFDDVTSKVKIALRR